MFHSQCYLVVTVIHVQYPHSLVCVSIQTCSSQRRQALFYVSDTFLKSVAQIDIMQTEHKISISKSVFLRG
jgi:hypothetical protein